MTNLLIFSMARHHKPGSFIDGVVLKLPRSATSLNDMVAHTLTLTFKTLFGKPDRFFLRYNFKIGMKFKKKTGS